MQGLEEGTEGRHFLDSWKSYIALLKGQEWASDLIMFGCLGLSTFLSVPPIGGGGGEGGGGGLH
jgi:hypothetical protein